MSHNPLVKRELLPDGSVQHTPVTDALTITGDPDRERERIMLELRKIMFTRGHRHGWAFQPLIPPERGALLRTVEQYSAAGKLTVASKNEGQDYRTLSINHIAKTLVTTPTTFCETADKIATSLVQHITPMINKGQTLWILPWRAGLVLGAQAAKAGFKRFFHLGARRNEETLETSIYYTARQTMSDITHVVIADPMLATGNTVLTALKELTFSPETELYSLSIIAAPEGVDNVLDKFPHMKVITGKLDECLNHRGFIVPGLGDFGDRYWEGLPESHITHWHEDGLLSKEDIEALRKRMTEK